MTSDAVNSPVPILGEARMEGPHPASTFTSLATLEASSFMKSNPRFLLAIAVFLIPVGACLPGCSQADNPAPVTAAPPPAPKAEEVKVPKKVGGQAYGSNEQYQRSMERQFGTKSGQ